MPEPKVRTKTPPLMEHDRAFKPSNPAKRGYNKSLSPFPKYVEDPVKHVERNRERENEDEKPKFKPTHIGKSRPSPSVQTNMRNLKASFPTVFKR